MEVNAEKNHDVVFRKGGRLRIICWNYDNEFIDNVENFDYLGTTLNFNGSFYKTKCFGITEYKSYVLYIPQNEAIAFEHRYRIVIL